MPEYLLRLWFIAFILVPLVIKGQDKPENFFRLGDKDLAQAADTGTARVLAASRSLKALDDLPVTVYVISRDEILGNGYVTLVDALASLPGIRVSQPGSAAEGEAFQVRGVYGNYYCKILLDGVEINPSVTGGMPIGAQLPVRQAERIEVIFGPSAASYGGEAMAGIINIVSLQSERPVTAQADIAIGTDAFEYLNVTIGGKFGKNKNVVSYSLFGANARQRDMNIRYDRDYLYNPALYDSSYAFLQKPYYHGDSTGIDMDRLPLISGMLGATFRWRGLSLSALGMTRGMHAAVGLDPSVYRYDDPTDTWAESVSRYTLAFEKQGKKWATLGSLAWLNYRLDNRAKFGLAAGPGPGGAGYVYAASDDILFGEQLTFTPITGLELSAGVNYRYSGNLPLTNLLPSPFKTDDYKVFSEEPVPDTTNFSGFGFNPVTFHQAGAYLQIFYQTGRFTLFGGYRLDHHSYFDLAGNPRLALMYRTGKEFSVRASFSTGYRAPSTHYMFASRANMTPDGIHYEVVPNRGLDPERILALEAGIRWDRLDWLRLDAALFYHRISDQFTRSFIFLDSAEYPLAVNPSRIALANVNDGNSNATLAGLQADVSFRNILPAIALDADINLTLARGKEVLPNDLGNLDDYREMPVFQGQFDLSFAPQERIRLFIRNSLSTGWVRGFLPLAPDLLREAGYPVDIKGFYRLDLRSRFIISRFFEAFAQFNNLTNARYGGIDAGADQDDLLYNPQYGFNFRLGLSFRME